MSNLFKNIAIGLLACFVFPVFAQENRQGEEASPEKELDVRAFILDHIADSYEWHLVTIKGEHVSIPLPIIVKGENSGWHFFLSSALHSGHEHEGFYVAPEGKYKGKIVEKNTSGEEIRPLDLSITKNAASLLMSSTLLIWLIMSVVRWYKKRQDPENFEAPRGFPGFIEMVVVSLNDDLIKPCIGKDSARFAPYLLTVFFFIILNNLLGLIPLFPGGANVTGNIAVTLVLALTTFIVVNSFGTKEYWKEIFWPDVPMWLKVPIPIMPALEIVGMFTKPFALMIRLFANILAGHSIVLGLVCLIFVTVKLGPVINGSMTAVSVIMTIFIDCVEILVAYIQAYVFTMLSAVFIGLARVEPHHHKG